MRIGNNEKKLFMFLLQQKFLTLEIIDKMMSSLDPEQLPNKRPKIYFRLYHLVNAGYIKKHNLDGFDVYILTQEGREEISALNKYNIPLVSFSELDTIRHELRVSDIRHYLEFHGAADWISDRTLRLHADSIPQIPDGACTVKGKTIFVEVELSRKSKDRYEKIADIYMDKKGPDRVIYFHEDESVIDHLRTLTRNHERLGFFRYDDRMHHPGNVMGTCASQEMTLARFLGLT